jgi:multiple sugar transport system permease protein
MSRRRHAPLRPRKSVAVTAAMTLVLVYSLFPLYWLVINATKSMGSLFSSPSLWLASDFALWTNIIDTLTYNDGIYLRWLLNTIFYTVVGAGGATLIAAFGGYGLAKHDFPGKRAVFAIVIAAVAVPTTALTVPTFLLFSEFGLTNTPWAVILPSLVTPFGLFLMWVYVRESVPTELIEAARIDGAGEIRIFFSVALRLIAPGLVSVLLLEMVASWNSFFLPLIMLSESQLYPLTVGLNLWNAQSTMPGAGDVIFNLVLTGALIMIVPIIIAFLVLQRFWQAGITAGSLK